MLANVSLSFFRVLSRTDSDSKKRRGMTTSDMACSMSPHEATSAPVWGVPRNISPKVET